MPVVRAVETGHELLLLALREIRTGSARGGRRAGAPVLRRPFQPAHEAHGSTRTGRCAHRRQVFGLAGTHRRTGGPTGRRFPGSHPVLHDGGRSHSPLRGSPGFPPGSLLPRPGPAGTSRTVGPRTVGATSDAGTPP